MRKHPVLWVLLVDGEHARVVVPTVALGQFATSFAIDSATAHQRSADMLSERPGRVHESASATRHAVEPRSDPHRLAKHAFVVDVARQIGEHATAHAFDRLLLVAPSHALNAVREALPPAAAGLVVATLDKDLLKTPDRDLGDHLGEWWVAPPAG